jgi:methionyl aminopeptidase
MMTKVKTAQEIVRMRESGRMLGTVLNMLEQATSEGMTTADLDRLATDELKKLGGELAFKGVPGPYPFPAGLCVSVNDAVVHGIPGDYVLKYGDIVSMDFGVRFEGMITDAARTVIVGKPSAAAQRLVMATKESLDAGIRAICGGCRVGDISAAVQTALDRENLGIVRDLVGHGVGHELHEDPNIPNYGKSETGPKLLAGMTIAVEPMATLGDWRVFVDRDEWTIRTYDGSLAAHFEDTILVTDEGSEVLTRV